MNSINYRINEYKPIGMMSKYNAVICDGKGRF